MAIEIKHDPDPKELPTPRAEHIALFRDLDGRYMVKDSTGAVRLATREDFTGFVTIGRDGSTHVTPIEVPLDFEDELTRRAYACAADAIEHAADDSEVTPDLSLGQDDAIRAHMRQIAAQLRARNG